MVTTAQQATQSLITQVNALVPTPLSANQANSLTNSLDSAIKALDKGHINAACSKLQDFSGKVNAYITGIADASAGATVNQWRDGYSDSAGMQLILIVTC